MSRLKQSIVFLSLCAAFLLNGYSATSAQMRKAPSWEGVEWINLAPGQESLDVSDFKGRVIYLSFFQKW